MCLHNRPWFCESCKGAILGATDLIQDWPLIDHLLMGWMPQDVDKANQVKQLGEMYWACSNELQVLVLAIATLPEHWLDIQWLVAWAQLLTDTHNSLGKHG